MDESEETLRRRARTRSSLLPGMGFALLGYPAGAALGLALTTLLLTSLAVSALDRASSQPG
jgi:hypothetical protein